MSDLLGRAYLVAKSYLDAARDRLEAVDAQAQAELRRALPREGGEGYPPAPNPGGVGETDPFARASAKIAAAQARVAAQRQEQEQREQATSAPPTPVDPVATAYKIIGVPAGSDYVTVRAAVDQLRARCAPTRFPEGSAEQAEARVILQRVEEASQVLQNALGPQSGGRFDKLEL